MDFGIVFRAVKRSAGVNILAEGKYRSWYGSEFARVYTCLEMRDGDCNEEWHRKVG